MTANPVPNKLNATLRLLLRLAALVAALHMAALPVQTATAQDSPRPATERPATEGPANDGPAPSITHQKFRIGGAEVAFTATAATLPLTSAKGERQAGMFYVAYTRDGAAHETRPITFVFNGGPGASSAYLHIGALGPRIVDFGPDGQIPQPPGRLIDNPDSWLDLSDLVFIDSVGTGYSRANGTGDGGAKRYWGIREDLRSIATFIDRYLGQTGRQVSPKYLVGESYGGLRAAALPQMLADDHDIAIAGIFLISPVLEFSLIAGDNRLALLPDALRLPSYAAVTLARTTTPTPEALAEAERFALGPYLTALAAGPRNAQVMRALYPEIARYTGLSETIVAQHEGRVPLGVFVKEAHRTDKLLISRYDGSVTAPDPYPESTGAQGDALFDGLRTVLAHTMIDYLAGSLGVHTDLSYHLTNSEVVRQWNWRSGLSGREGYAGASDALRDVLAGNRGFKVVVAHGMTDLVTPYFTSRYVIDQLPPSLTTDRVTLNLYPGGHMMYLRAASRARLHADAARLYPPPPL